MPLFARPMVAVSASLLLCGLGGRAHAQTPAAAAAGAIALPEIDIAAPKPVQHPRRPRTHVVSKRRLEPPVAPPPQTAAQALAGKNATFDDTRRNIVAATVAGSYELSQQALEAQPQGANTPLDKALLQVPGVSQDSAASGALHVRNEHANLQYRINGIMLPDGVGAFGQIIDTG